MPIMPYAMIFLEPEDLLTSLRFLANDKNSVFPPYISSRLFRIWGFMA
jgi:hypothetical protein